MSTFLIVLKVCITMIKVYSPRCKFIKQGMTLHRLEMNYLSECKLMKQITLLFAEISWKTTFFMTNLSFSGSRPLYWSNSAHHIDESVEPQDASTFSTEWHCQVRVFPGGNPWSPPPVVKILPAALHLRPFLWPKPVSPPQVLSPKISKNVPHFSLNFGFFLAQNCIRKLYFMLKTPKLLYGSIFGLSGQFLQVPPHLTPSPTQVPPPTWLHPRRGLKIIPESKSHPHQNFCVKTLQVRDELSVSV